MKHRIWVENNQTQRPPFRGYKSALRRAIEAVLDAQGFDKKAEISVSLVSSEEIRDLNLQYRGVDRPTDVLSFPMFDSDLPADVAYLGDIIICPLIIFEQAKQFGTTYRQEMCLMAIHSTLHLLGWDHIKPAEKKTMFALQEKILSQLEGCEIKTEQERKE